MSHSLFTFLVLSCILLACGSERIDQGGDRVINPNGDSELALLMRDMFEDGMRTKAQILAGEQPEINTDFHHIRHASATEPQKVASEDYAHLAKVYEATAESLLTSEHPERGATYQMMVGACMSCHQVMCPGPMVKIKKMYLTESELKGLSSVN